MYTLAKKASFLSPTVGAASTVASNKVGRLPAVWSRVLPPLPLQAKLTVNQPNDTHEQEADRVAAQVMRMPDPAAGVVRRCACGGIADETGECPACRAKRLGLQRQSDAAGGVAAPPSVHATLRAPGQPLDGGARAFMESRFGHDFGGVRVHTGSGAAASARAVGAQAYTVGQNVVFGEGRYAPGTTAGKQLLAHELAHVVQQGAMYGSVPVLQRQGSTCTRTFTRATTFASYIDLVREAETRLIGAGYSSVYDRIHVLRGIYYGTDWSADYLVEASPVRNLGFQTYTASTTLADPRPHLQCGLFDALRGSQDLTDGRRRVDAGHLMIGLDARRSWTARTVPIPTQGGTGLELSTWLGDLGGGAGMLAYRRVSDPTRRVMTVFSGTDFGGAINLEGDVAGFVVGRDTSTTPASAVPLAIAPGRTIADALQDYLLPPSGGSATTSPEWESRCTTFLRMYGGNFNPSRTLTNRAGLITNFKAQIQDFACWYLVNRLRQSGRLSLTTLRAASLHIPSTSEEVATVFVDALVNCHTSRGASLAATGTGPAPIPAGTSAPTPCSLAIGGLEAAEEGQRRLQEGERWLRSLGVELPF